MSWTDRLGQFVSWLGDVSGVSDVADEFSSAIAEDGISRGEWGSILWQGAQTPFESATVPFRAAANIGEAYYEDVFRPGVNIAKAGALALQAPLWQARGESYGDYLSRAWDRRDDVSWGEIGWMGNTRVIDNIFGGDSNGWRHYDPFVDGDIERWRGSGLDLLSGAADFTKDIFFDPLTYAGAPVKAAQAMAKGARVVSMAEKAHAGVMARRGLISADEIVTSLESGAHAETLGFLGRETNPAVLSQWAERSGLGIADPDAFAHLAAPLNGTDEATDLMRVLYLGDADAGARLVAAHGVEYDLTLNSSKWADDAIRQLSPETGELIDADPHLERMLGDYLAGTEQAGDVADAVRRAEEYTRGVSKLLDEPATGARRFLPDEDRLLGRARAKGSIRSAVRGSQGITRDAIVTTYQPSRLHPGVFVVERPSGLVRPESADAFGEVAAQIRELDRLTSGELVRSGLADEVTQRWMAAATLTDPASARGAVAHSLNRIGMGLMKRKYGLSDELADELYRLANERSTKVTTKLREQGWLGLALDNGSMGILRAPVLQRTTPNAVQLWDWRRIDRTLSRFEGTRWQKVYHSALTSGTADVLDMVNTIFKTSVLMRLGYTIRNLAEASLSIAAVGRLGHVSAAVGYERMATLLRSAKLPALRLVDQLAMSFGWRDNPLDVQHGLVGADAALDAKQSQLDQLAHDLAYVDHDTLLRSADEAEQRLGRQILAHKTTLGEHDITWHGTDGDLTLDPARPLPTTSIHAAAQRHADAGAWQPLHVADFAEGADERGLMGPHPDIDRGYRGGASPLYHGGPRWAGDKRDPRKRGDVRIDPDRVGPQELIGPAFYTTDGKPVAGAYAAANTRGQTYTVIWQPFRAPQIFDADRPWRDIPEAGDFFDQFTDDLREAAAALHGGTPPGFDKRIADARARALTPEDTDLPLSQYASAQFDGVRVALDQVAAGQLDPDDAVGAIDIMLQSPLTPEQRQLAKEARALVADPDVDPQDIADLVDDMSRSYSAAYWWNLSATSGDDFIGSMGRLAADIVSEVIVGNGLGDEAVDAFLGRYFGRTSADLADEWNTGRGFQQLDLDSDDPSRPIVLESLTALQRAFNDHLRGEGYDAIRHTGGLNFPGNPQHAVTAFINTDDVRVVGDDWLDWDNAKVLSAARDMAIQLRGQLQTGAKVRRVDYDHRPNPGLVADGQDAIGYTDVTTDRVERWINDPVALTREFGYSQRKKDALMFQRRFETLAPGRKPTAHPVASYGPTADLTSWATVPDDIRRALRWRHHVKTDGPKRRVRSYTGDLNAAKAGDKAAVARITQAAYDAGYARVVLPDRAAFGGRQILVDPRAVGPAGLERRIQQRIDQVAATAEAGVELGAPTRVTRDTRRAERAARERDYRAGGNPNPRPVVPSAEARLAQAHLNDGLEDAVAALVTDRAALRAQRDQLATRLATAQARRARLQPLAAQGKGFGTRDFTVRGPHGEDYTVAGPFAGEAGSLYARMASSDDTYHNLVIGSELSLKAGAGMGPVSVAPTNPRYFEAWSNILNMHFRDPESRRIDPLVERVLDGMSYEEAVHWATSTADGYQWAHAIGLPRSSTARLSRNAEGSVLRDEALAKAQAKVSSSRSFDPDDVEEALAGLFNAVDLYLPEGPLRDAFRAGGDISETVIRRARRGQDNPQLHALLIPTSKEARMAWSKKDYARAGVTKVMRVLGALPETAFARHPLYAAAYRDEMTTRIGLAAERKGEALTVAEVNELAKVAHQSARKDLEQTLFTLVRRSNASSALVPRLLFPFAGAYENVLRRWSRFAVDDPSMVARGASMVAKVAANVTFVTPEGEPIDGASGLTMDSYMVMPGMEDVGRFIGGKYGAALANQAAQVRVPVASLDVLFQGRPTDPGLGPIGLVPVVEVVRRKPSFEQFFQWALPYGVPESDADMFLPAWGRRLKSRWTDDGVWTNTVAEIYLLEQWKFEHGQRDDPPRLGEVADMAGAFFTIRTLTNLLAPVSVNYTSERDFYVAKLRALREAYRDEPGGYQRADAEFFAQFPDAGMLVQSLSRNPSRAAATVGAQENLTRYQEEAASAYALGDPELAGFIANYGGAGQQPFSDAVYEWQRHNAAVEGSSDTYRQVANPEESVRSARVSEGWRTWRGITEHVAAQLVLSGVQADSRQYAEVMRQAKAYAAETIAASGNEDWMFAYMNPDTAKYHRRASWFGELLGTQFAEDHADDPLVQAIGMYLGMRQQVDQLVDARAKGGGHTTLAAQSNQDIAIAWEAMVNRMKSDSEAFAEWHDRYFANDPVVMR